MSAIEPNVVQRGNPTDPRHASGMAHRRPRADVVHARGPLQLPRTGVRHARGKVKTKRHIRIASWNVGTMKGRSLEVVETLERRNIDICCVQETMNMP